MSKQRRSGLLFAVVLSLLASVSVGRALGAPPHPAPVPSDPPTLTFIAIIPSTGAFGTSDGILAQGTELPFFATGFYSDNSTRAIHHDRDVGIVGHLRGYDSG